MGWENPKKVVLYGGMFPKIASPFRFIIRNFPPTKSQICQELLSFGMAGVLAGSFHDGRKWLITMVIGFVPLVGLWDPFQMAFQRGCKSGAIRSPLTSPVMILPSKDVWCQLFPTFFTPYCRKNNCQQYGVRDFYHQHYIAYVGGTHLKTNMPPENKWLEDVFPIKMNSPFFGTC